MATQMNALALLTGDDSAEVSAHLRRAILAWIADDDTGPSLQQRLGLSRRSARCELRNQHLRQAAEYLDGTGWPRAVALAEAARAFSIRRLPRWKRYGIPDNASLSDVALFKAAQFGEITLSARQLFNILD